MSIIDKGKHTPQLSAPLESILDQGISLTQLREADCE